MTSPAMPRPTDCAAPAVTTFCAAAAGRDTLVGGSGFDIAEGAGGQRRLLRRALHGLSTWPIADGGGRARWPSGARDVPGGRRPAVPRRSAGRDRDPRSRIAHRRPAARHSRSGRVRWRAGSTRNGRSTLPSRRMDGSFRSLHRQLRRLCDRRVRGRSDRSSAPSTPIRAEPSWRSINRPATTTAGCCRSPQTETLYIALGDGGGGGDPFGNGRDPSTLLGAMLRIDVDGAEPYAIPPDNPFVAGGGAA